MSEEKEAKNVLHDEKELDVDDFLDRIGQFGKTQIILVSMFCLIIIPTTYQTLIMSFVASSPPWQCVDNATDCQLNGTMKAKNDDRCDMDRLSWMYTKQKSFSIVTDWDLVCHKKELAYLANSGMFIGWAFGAVVLGWISDRYGRKIVLFPSWLAVILAAFASGFVNNYWLFLVLRIWIGFFQGGIGLTLFVMATELVGPKYRSFAGTTIWFAFTFALCAMAFKAWLVPKWQLLEVISSIPYIIFLAFYKFIPESVRWCRVNNKLDQAENILRDVAKRNGKPWPNVKLSPPPKSSSERHASFIDLFTPNKMCVSTLVQCFAWFVNGQVYYGISLASDHLGGNMYRDFILTSLVEIPGNILVIVCTNRLGRKPAVIGSMVVGGLACIGVAFIDPTTSVLTWSRVSLGMLGKLCITLSFNSLYIWSVELYPTTVRSQGMGLLSVVSRIGAATAPWIAQWLGHINKMLPFGVMGTLTLISAGLCWELKETRGLATAETLEDTNKPTDSGVDESHELDDPVANNSSYALNNHMEIDSTKL